MIVPKTNDSHDMHRLELGAVSTTPEGVVYEVTAASPELASNFAA